jgi:hypothetical protein
MLHQLKIHPPYYDRVLMNEKTFEVRKNDRDFQVNDQLDLREYDPVKNEYTGKMVIKTVSYVLHGGQFGIEAGYCVLGLRA